MARIAVIDLLNAEMAYNLHALATQQWEIISVLQDIETTQRGNIGAVQDIDYSLVSGPLV